MKKGRILIVEDEAIIALLTKNYLEKMDYEVAAIYSKAEDVLNNYEALNVDLILMDIFIPGEINGIETVRRIKEKNNIPVIFLTANTDEVTFQQAKSTNPFGFISKPFDFNTFNKLVMQALESV